MKQLLDEHGERVGAYRVFSRGDDVLPVRVHASSKWLRQSLLALCCWRAAASVALHCSARLRLGRAGHQPLAG